MQELADLVRYFSPSSLYRDVRHIIRKVRDRGRWMLAHIWRRLMFRTTVIAITGSVGKSTTKECLAAILSVHGKTLKTRNNRNDELGVPHTIRAMRPWHRFAVIEVATSKPGVIERLARMVRPDIAIVLTVARTHTNMFPTLEDTAEEKAQLLNFVARRGTVILNGNDERVRRMAERSRAKVVLFGSTKDCDIIAADPRSSWPETLRFEVLCEAERVPVHTQLVGTHWVSSVLASLAAARACGISLTAAADALSDVAPFAGRMQPVALPNGAVLIRDEENASPDSLEAMLKVMRESRAARRVLVLSDVSDVKAKPRKRQADLGRIAAQVADVAVFVDDHGEHAVRAAVSSGMDPGSCHVAYGLGRAAELLKSELRAGDLAFIKGRATHHLSRIVFAQFGAIGCWTESCKIKYLCDVCTKLRPEFDLRRALSAPVHGSGASYKPEPPDRAMALQGNTAD